jgi:hypothetical protein
MSKKTKIIIVVVLLILAIAGSVMYYKHRNSAAAALASGDLEKLKTALASESYKLFTLKSYATRIPKPADADAKLAAQQKIVDDLNAKIKALTA